MNYGLFKVISMSKRGHEDLLAGPSASALQAQVRSKGQQSRVPSKQEDGKTHTHAND